MLNSYRIPIVFDIIPKSVICKEQIVANKQIDYIFNNNGPFYGRGS